MADNMGEVTLLKDPFNEIPATKRWTKVDKALVAGIVTGVAIIALAVAYHHGIFTHAAVATVHHPHHSIHTLGSFHKNVNTPELPKYQNILNIVDYGAMAGGGLLTVGCASSLFYRRKKASD